MAFLITRGRCLRFWVSGIALTVCTLLHVSAAPLDAGLAEVDLTPPLEMKAALGGYGERMSRPATGVHDRIWAKAIVFCEGSQRRSIVTADVLAFPPGFREALAQALAADGWKAEDLLLLPSHTHTSFDMTALNPKNTFQIPQLGLYHKELHAWALAKLVEVIRSAAKQPAPVAAGTVTRALTDWNRNRRDGKTTDRDLTVVRIDTDKGAPLAVLVNWTAHPTFMDSDCMEFSGDWPGHLQRTLGALIGQGVVVLYFNGAEGDQSPTPRVAAAPPWEQAERYGRELALEAWHVWQECKAQSKPAFAWHTSPVKLPTRTAHPDFMKTGGKEYGLSESNVGTLLDHLCPAETHTVSVRLGDLIIASVPGEMAAELGLEVKAAIRGQTNAKYVAVGGLANEWVSYLLSPEQYRRGGYEASVSFYGENLGPEVVRQVANSACKLK